MTQHYKISKNASLPVRSDNKDYIPPAIQFENHKKLLEQTALCINKQLPLLLIGETGTGKTSLVRQLAHNTNNGFRRVNHNGGTTIEDITGRLLINEKGTYWIDGVLIDAMKKGYWYLADEINASTADINFVYHSLLDDDGYIVLPENNGEIVRPHENFRFFATMNPASDYVGTKELNRALLSRFIVLKTDYPPPKTESTILVKRTGIKREIADKMIAFAGEVRSNHSKGKANFVLSTRELLQWGGMFSSYGKYILSAEMTILNKVGGEDFESVKDLLALHFKTLDEPVSKKPVKAQVPVSEAIPTSQ